MPFNFRFYAFECDLWLCVCPVASIVPDSLQPYGLQPAKFLSPSDFSRQEYCMDHHAPKHFKHGCLMEWNNQKWNNQKSEVSMQLLEYSFIFFR